MDDLLEKYKNSDVVCYATPVYLCNMTACLKNFLDRLIPTKSPNMVEHNGNYDMEGNIRKVPDIVIISNAGFPGENNFYTMRDVMKTAQPILEIYRNYGMLLKMNDECIKQKVQNYLAFVKQAGYFVAKELPMPDEVQAGLSVELLPAAQYAQVISGQKYANSMIEKLGIQHQQLMKATSNMTAAAVSPEQVNRLFGYLEKRASIGFEGRRQVAAGLIAGVKASSEIIQIKFILNPYSTVTLLVKFRGLSTGQPRATAV